ncbi:MAG: chloride channel protein [Chromatiales bacterium]|nr:chloride channel protein [Gammaproteobacteria bacterium]MCP5353051.1 chloride channel protein [Chromatiales bacterium]
MLRIRFAFVGGALLAGLVVSGLAIGSLWADHLFRWIVSVNPYLPLLTLPLGLMAITALLKLFPGTQGSGIPQAFAALRVPSEPFREMLLSMRIAIGKVLLVMAALACGASVGREGPSVHVGAAIMYSFRRFARVPDHRVGHGLILAGSAAGIAAAFNTPLAGVVFAIEEMSRAFDSKTAGNVLTAVVLAGLVAIVLQGEYVYFGEIAVNDELLDMVPAILICGGVGGLLGGGFAQVLLAGSGHLRSWYVRYPVWIAGGFGLLVAITGLLSGGQIYGTGYDEARALLTGEGETGALFALWKALATLFSYWSGIPGGIFAPSLAVGAGVGATLADGLSALGLFVGVGGGAVVLLGMAGYFTGVVQTPLTAVIIIMEMTQGQTMLLPLMVTALIASAVSRRVCPVPIYEALAQHFLHAWRERESKQAV